MSIEKQVRSPKSRADKNPLGGYPPFNPFKKGDDSAKRRIPPTRIFSTNAWIGHASSTLRIAFTATLLGLSACSSLQDRFQDQDAQYREGANTAPVVDPKLLGLPPADDYFPLPPKPPGAFITDEEPSLLPPDSPLAAYQRNSLQALHFKVPLDQAWKQLGKALQQAGFELLEEDDVLYLYYTLDISQTGGKVTPDSPLYQWQVLEQKEGGSRLILLDEDSRPLDAKKTQALLTRLQPYLTSILEEPT